MKLGFTGTREGMTNAQWVAVERLMTDLNPTEAHHGDCLGSDERFHQIVRVAFPAVAIIVHPPTDRRLRAYCHGTRILAPLPYLVRDQAIVDACDVLIATPKGPEETRSGTWATVRMARRAGKRIVVVWPDGQVSEGGDRNERPTKAVATVPRVR